MNISQEGEWIRRAYYDEYVQIMNIRKENPIPYNEFTIEFWHNFRVKNLPTKWK